MSKFEVDYVAELGHRRDMVAKFCKTLTSTGCRSYCQSKGARRCTQLKSRIAKADFLNEKLKVSRGEVADVKSVVEEQRALLDTARIRLFKSKSR